MNKHRDYVEEMAKKRRGRGSENRVPPAAPTSRWGKQAEGATKLCYLKSRNTVLFEPKGAFTPTQAKQSLHKWGRASFLS